MSTLEPGQHKKTGDELEYCAHNGKKYKFRAPKKKLSVLQDIFSASLSNPARAMAASIGLCNYFGLGKLKANFFQMNCNVGAYGGAVMDELLELGWTPSEIMVVGSLIFADVQENLIDLYPSQTQVDEEKGFLGETTDSDTM